MVLIVQLALFALALALVLAVMADTLMPALPRIMAIFAGQGSERPGARTRPRPRPRHSLAVAPPAVTAPAVFARDRRIRA